METALNHGDYQTHGLTATQNGNNPVGLLTGCTAEEIYDDANICQESELGSESGVEPDYAEWVFDTQNDEGVLFDLSNEHALATLRYFRSIIDRTNMMTKYQNNHLDLPSLPLSDKEKDLALAAQIGQSLLQRNKSLMEKIEKMEDYLSSTKENEEQLKHDLHLKSELVRMYYEDDEQKSLSSGGSRNLLFCSSCESCDDEEMLNLTKRCRQLEKENHYLFIEALSLREVPNDMEKKEDLIFDLHQQHSEAKEQITNLTDEIAQKFEDNVQQQEEITQLINMVVELQKRQKQLNIENEILQNQLEYTNQNESSLQEQLLELQAKFRETHEMLQENQEEMKQLKETIGYGDSPTSWLNDLSNSLMLQDSLANEIEESVRRDLSYTQECRTQHNKVLNNVRRLNLRPHEPLSRSTSGRTSPVSNWSTASDKRSESITWSLSIDSECMRTKKTMKKLQIVKPMEGSETLNKWHHLASQNINGGLTFSERENSPPRKTEGDISFDDDRSTVVEEEEKIITPLVESPTDDEQPAQTNSRFSPKQSTPQGYKSMFSLLNTLVLKKRTIITRNSAALTSLMQGRKMWNGNGEEGKTKSEVIDMIANAMNKVKVEAQTGQRILSSLKSGGSGRERALSLLKLPEYKDYTDMPNVSRVLEKAANAKAAESEATLSPERVLSSLEPNDAVNELPKVALNSISGPLGLLNRANPIDTNENIMSRLYRLSGNTTTTPKPDILKSSTSFDVVNEVDFDSGISTAGSLDSAVIRRNQSSGALVDMTRNKPQSNLRQFGMTSMLGSSSDNSLGNLKETSKSVETGLDSVKKKDESTSSVYNGFFSFLGKLT